MQAREWITGPVPTEPRVLSCKASSHKPQVKVENSEAPIRKMHRSIGNHRVVQLLQRRSNEREGTADLPRLTAARSPRSPMQRKTEGKAGEADPHAGGAGAGRKLTESGAATLLWVLDDVLAYETNRLISDMGEWQDPFEHLYYSLVGHDSAHKKIPGRERREMFDEAVLALRPVLAYASDAQRGLLQRKRTALLRAEAENRVESSVVVDKKIVEVPDERHPREQLAVIRPLLPKLVQNAQAANEMLLRLGHEDLKAALHHLEKEGHADILSRLAMLQGMLAFADGLLTLSDEKLLEELKHLPASWHGVTNLAELAKALVEVGGGAASLTALAAAAVAKASGDAALSAAALSAAGEIGHMLGDVVAGVEVVHGILVLLDPKASRAEKERGAFGAASGGAWFIGKRIGGETLGATMGAAASFAVTATYLELKAAAYLYWQGALGLSTGLMREAFEYMQSTGASLARMSGELTRAGLLLQEEHDPIKAEPLAKIVAETTNSVAIQIDWFLQHCLSTGKDMGLGSIDPAGWPGNYRILAQVFAPLQPLRSAKSGPALIAAATAVLERITWCLAHAGEIVEAGARHKDLHDMEKEAAKKAEGHEE